MSTLVMLAAAPDAVAPVSAAVCALLFFFIIVPLAVHGNAPTKKLPKTKVLADSDQPLEDQVGV